MRTARMKTNGGAGFVLAASILLTACSGEKTAASDPAGPVTIDDRTLARDGAGPDGRLDLAEYKTASRSVLTRLDANGDGALSTAEVQRLPENRRQGWLFGDVNRDGTLTAAEYEAITPAKFTMRDRNHDQAITPDEIPEGTPASGFLF